jgi:hypothetical protein
MLHTIGRVLLPPCAARIYGGGARLGETDGSSRVVATTMRVHVRLCRVGYHPQASSLLLKPPPKPPQAFTRTFVLLYVLGGACGAVCCSD